MSFNDEGEDKGEVSTIEWSNKTQKRGGTELKDKNLYKKYKSEDKKMKFLKVELTKLSCNKDSFKYDHKEEFSPIKAFND